MKKKKNKYICINCGEGFSNKKDYRHHLQCEYDYWSMEEEVAWETTREIIEELERLKP